MKQILLVNDIVGYSKVGMGAMVPILSHMGVSSYYLPTALVSNNLAYEKFNIQENTDYIRRTLEVWRELGFRFDAMCTGLMFSEAQADLLSAYCAEAAAGGTTVFVDPILGDSGRLYNGISPRQVQAMREMVGVAHLTFPNYTEACYLTDTPYNPAGTTWDEARAMLDHLVGLGCRSAVITSCCIDGQKSVCGYGHHSQAHFRISYEEIPGEFDGTGDIFSAILIGHLLRDEALQDSTRAAMRSVSRMIERHRNNPDPRTGIPVEECFDLL